MITTAPFPPSPPAEEPSRVPAREGHNSIAAADQLKSIVERVERLQEERKAIADDIADVYGEARSNGYDVKAIKAVVKYRAEDAAKRDEFDAVFTTYLNALAGGA
jgi:uncharacterized protein (UPF0335 family)